MPDDVEVTPPGESPEDAEGDGSEEGGASFTKAEAIMEVLRDPRFLATAKEVSLSLTNTVKSVSDSWVAAFKESGTAYQQTQVAKALGGSAAIAVQMVILWALAHGEGWKSADLVPLFLPTIGATLLWMRSK